MTQKKLGFTLIEVLIVITVVGLLAVLVIVALRGSLFKGHDARRKADTDRIKIAAEEYEKDHNCYPKYIICGQHPEQPVYPYLKDVPCDPVNGVSYFYFFENRSCPGWFKVYTVLENENDTSAHMNIGPNGAFNYVTSSPNAPLDYVPSPQETGSQTPAPPGNQSGFYGCQNGICVPISWNPNRPGPECDPNYQQSDCLGECGQPGVPNCTQVDGRYSSP